MTSLWLDRSLPSYPVPVDGAEFDVLIVGAGLTVDLLTEMARDLSERGGQIFTGDRVRSVRPGRPVVVGTDSATLRGRTVVLATGIPIMDRGFFWARLEPLRSYAASFHIPAAPPQGMYLSAESPTRSIRSIPRDTGELLLTGGNGHGVGRAANPAGRVCDLIDWTSATFPGAELTHSWSAQDYHSDHELPFIGPLRPGQDNVLVATGFDKWGMTMAVASGVALSSRILGGRPSGQRHSRPGRPGRSPVRPPPSGRIWWSERRWSAAGRNRWWPTAMTGRPSRDRVGSSGRA